MKGVLRCLNFGNCSSVLLLHELCDLTCQNLRFSVYKCGLGGAGLEEGSGNDLVLELLLSSPKTCVLSLGGATCHLGVQGAGLTGKGGAEDRKVGK